MMGVDYLKNDVTFKANIEKEAKSFRPPGEKVYSYARPATHRRGGKGKGKGKDLPVSDPESTDVSTFEAYHVSTHRPMHVHPRAYVGLHCLNLHPCAVAIELPLLTLLRASKMSSALGKHQDFAISTDECNSSSYYILKRVLIFKKMKRNGSFLSCESSHPIPILISIATALLDKGR